LREAADLSPGGGIRMMRLERAAQPLEQQAGTIAEVAYAVGYRDANYFDGSEARLDVYPNPFHAETALHYTLPEAGRVVLRIYDGKKISSARL